MKIFFSSKCLEYNQPGHPESPERVESTYRHLRDLGYEFLDPEPCKEKDVLLAHSPELLERVKSGNFYDLDTPAYPGIFDIAMLSAGSAVCAMKYTLENGEKTFSLMRPPGHHATRDDLGGFCYFNNIAIASLKALSFEGIKKVAVIDFDCHHGNGTEDILRGRKEFMYLSLHQSPLYPGTGLRSVDNCINYPVPANTGPERYLSLFEDGLGKIKTFDPDLIAVSAGFDSYRLDPITNLLLEQETYFKIGSMIAGLNKPTFAILEGGYSRDLPLCIEQFLKGLENYML